MGRVLLVLGVLTVTACGASGTAADAAIPDSQGASLSNCDLHPVQVACGVCPSSNAPPVQGSCTAGQQCHPQGEGWVCRCDMDTWHCCYLGAQVPGNCGFEDCPIDPSPCATGACGSCKLGDQTCQYSSYPNRLTCGSDLKWHCAGPSCPPSDLGVTDGGTTD